MSDSINEQFGPFGTVWVGFLLLIFVALMIFEIAAFWKVNTKAGKPGWATIIPIYNYIVILEIVGRPLWWIFLLLIPGVNVVFSFIVHIDLARSFGRGTGFGVGLTLLSMIFFPILGFGDARYMGPAAGGPRNAFDPRLNPQL
jgi:hypothetical protein